MGTLLALLSFGLLIATFGLWAQRIQAVRVPKDRTSFVVAALVAVGLGLAAFGDSLGWLEMLCAGFGIFGGALFTLLIAISPQKTDGAIQVGDNVYAFVGDEAAALDDNDQPTAMSSYQGTPVLIKFFRGHW